MNKNNELDKYLSQVRSALGNHPEADEIIDELYTHIWDYASNLSRKSGCSVDDAFTLAIQTMEHPEELANTFHMENPQNKSTWREPKSVLPEKKLSDREFMYLGIISFFAASIILTLIYWVGQFAGIDFGAVNFLIGIIQFSILIALILGILYYRNEQEFQEQIHRIRKRFEKAHNKDGELTDETKKKIQAVGSHIEGLFQLIIEVIVLIGILYVSYISRWEVFTQNWYNIGIFAVVILTIFEIFRGMLKMFIGEIRITRLVNASVHIFTLIGSLIMIIFYPFDFSTWFATFSEPIPVMIADTFYEINSNPDHLARVLFGISAVLSLMHAMYNIFKFGTWKPSHQRSLTIAEGVQ